MLITRCEFITAVGATIAGGALHGSTFAAETPQRKRHIVTLSFDDGFKKSSIKTAEIFEKYKLSACINVTASGHWKDFKPPNDLYKNLPAGPDALGDFGLWNELKARGHEIMPHGFRHVRKNKVPFEEAKGLILRCLDVFEKELKGFDRKSAVFNFPHNTATPALEQWMPSQVRAFRVAGGVMNPLPRKGQAKLTCGSHGPDNCEAAIDQAVAQLLAGDSGWMIFNTHGMDEEGWGPVSSAYLDRLLARLVALPTVEVLPSAAALAKYAA